jgi:hypothetical protein
LAPSIILQSWYSYTAPPQRRIYRRLCTRDGYVYRAVNARDARTWRVASQQQYASLLRRCGRRRQRARPAHPRLDPSMGTHILLRRRYTYSSACTTKYTTLQTTTFTLQAWTKMGPHTIRRTPAHERANCRPPDTMGTLHAERTAPTNTRTRCKTDEPGVDGG